MTPCTQPTRSIAAVSAACWRGGWSRQLRGLARRSCGSASPCSTIRLRQVVSVVLTGRDPTPAPRLSVQPPAPTCHSFSAVLPNAPSTPPAAALAEPTALPSGNKKVQSGAEGETAPEAPEGAYKGTTPLSGMSPFLARRAAFWLQHWVFVPCSFDHRTPFGHSGFHLPEP